MATLVTSILTGKVAEAFRTKVPELSYFSTDFGKSGSDFAEPVKFGQEVISQMAIAPTASRFTPGDGLGSGAQNAKDLVTDIKVNIDLAAAVKIKLPVVDSIQYFLEAPFQASLMEAGKSLGRFVIADAVAKFGKPQFSRELVSTVAAAEMASLRSARMALNNIGCGAPRFVLGSTNWVGALTADPLIISGDYYGQRTESDPYVTLRNIEGFDTVREFPNMLSNTTTLGTFTVNASTDVATVSAAHGLRIGDRVRVSSGGTLPSNLTANTDFYVKTVPSSTTLTLAATPGGSQLDLDAGSGTHTIAKFEAINAFAGEKRAIHIAFRALLDNEPVRKLLGIPQTMNIVPGVEAESGLPFTWYLWQDGNGTNPTGDIYATGVVAYGIKAGREITDATKPGEVAAGSGFDNSGIRLVETASTN